MESREDENETRAARIDGWIARRAVNLILFLSFFRAGICSSIFLLLFTSESCSGGLIARNKHTAHAGREEILSVVTNGRGQWSVPSLHISLRDEGQ
jgi:hypothetical protein